MTYAGGEIRLDVLVERIVAVERTIENDPTTSGLRSLPPPNWVT